MQIIEYRAAFLFLIKPRFNYSRDMHSQVQQGMCMQN